MTDIDPDETLAEMRKFLTGIRTVYGYEELARRFARLDLSVSNGGPLPLAWQAPLARLLFIAESLTRLHREWHHQAARTPGPAGDQLRECAGYLETIVAAAGREPGGGPDITDPGELVDMATLLLERAREGIG